VTIFYPSSKSQRRLRSRVKRIVRAQVPVTIAEQVRRANRVLRGWVNYFRIGNSARVFQNIRWYVETRVRRVLQDRSGRYGLGWKRIGHDLLYGKLGLYDDYRVRWSP
jgi:RNA-directed DNA polymerase